VTVADDFVTIRDIDRIAGDVLLSGTNLILRLIQRIDGSIRSQGLNHRVEDINVIDGIVVME
jgi:hypothetical protein